LYTKQGGVYSFARGYHTHKFYTDIKHSMSKTETSIDNTIKDQTIYSVQITINITNQQFTLYTRTICLLTWVEHNFLDC